MAAEDSICTYDRQELDDTVSCCICTDIYNDPKALPCFHTFCMKCLQQVGLSTNKGPGDEMPCPICRRKFKIPSEGFPGLPNNFILAKLIQAANIPNPSEPSRDIICDVCLEDNQETEIEIPKANMYCTDCKQNLCENCCKQHRKFKLNKNHKMVSIDEQQVSNDYVTADLPSSVCVIHEEKVLDIYCDECKTVQCAVCFIDDHKHHEGSHVSKYVEDFRKQTEINIETIHGCSSKTMKKKAELLKIKEDMQQKVERLEDDIIRRKDELKQFVDSHANSLLQSLSLLNQSKLKNIQMETDDVDSHLSCLQSYSSYCQKMMNKGSASDICRTISELSTKAAELQEQCQSLNEREIEFFMASFKKSEFEQFLEDDNLIGEIDDDFNSRQKITSKSKVALIKEQGDEIDLLKRDINLERKEKETFRLDAMQLKMSLDNEQTTNKTLQVDNDKLKQELETHKKKLRDLIKEKEQAKEGLEKTLQADKDKLRHELETQKKAFTDLLRKNEEAKYDFEKTLQADKDKFRQEQETQKKDFTDLLKENEQAKKDLEKTLQADKEKLRHELETQKMAFTDLLKEEEQAKEDLKKTKTDMRTMIRDVEQKREEDRKISAREKKQLICQIEDHNRLMDELLHECKLEPILVQTIRTKAAEENKSIKGLTILDKELFVVSEKSSQVEVYDSKTFDCCRRWHLRELIDPLDIGSCNINKCLYIFDYKGDGRAKTISRIDTNGKLIKKWSTGNDYGLSLSVTDESNVILPLHCKIKVNEYSPDGQLIRELDIHVPTHPTRPISYINRAIKLNNGHFVIGGFFSFPATVSPAEITVNYVSNVMGYGSTYPKEAFVGLYIVDADGKLKQSCCKALQPRAQKNDKNQFDLSADKYGFLMVSNPEHSQILLLNSELKSKRFMLTLKHGLRHPTRILLDESNRRLFVVDNQRVFIFDFR